MIFFAPYKKINPVPRVRDWVTAIYTVDRSYRLGERGAGGEDSWGVPRGAYAHLKAGYLYCT